MEAIREAIVAALQGVPPQVTVVILAMLPILELRGAIPWALAPIGGDLSLVEAVPLAILGNMIPVIPLLLWIGPISDWLRKMPLLDRFFTWLFQRTRRKGRLVEKYQAVGLALFVAIPLPITGAWTGAAAAFLFGIPFRQALLATLAGVCISATIVTLATLGVLALW
ncbi:MAG: small multi-drug export protein [Candidatus Eisenbacteria bacterium]|uniref:Small multi-drug export protein n=1 Tax=Eiseniibacteriota bacterium TaxID=2212470 RepID=A0A948W3N6_UNCEI|nr:small multi-drug export protein [Candidatus Eisenbacteria bacterium]MBU1948407.1 small multi-drug export protein [Candidatus Eisenbacteria bacterium]MBU2691297.1 small multi-drug export protein [Candidatus Eisenbacteria bacterium]